MKVKNNDPDEIRELILLFMYEHHHTARGIQAQEIGVRELQREMKNLHGLPQQEVASNLDYLVQKEWVRAVHKERTFKTKAGTVHSSEQITYKISDVGIDRVEGESRFRRLSPFGGVNIANVQGVVIVGNKNVVHSQFVPLSNELELLRKEITESALTDSDKVDAIAEIQTIQSQLAKQKPDASIIKNAWTTVERIVTLGQFATLMTKAGLSIASLFS